MKVALYVETGTVQVVLTAENDWEQRIVPLLANKEILQVFQGGFYECNGGWIRQERGFGSWREDPKSIVFRLDDKKEAKEMVG